MSDGFRHDWTQDEIRSLYEQPLLELVFQAQQAHRTHFTPNTVQLSTLLSIKTGACPEDCSYCSQSAHFKTEVEKEKLLDIDTILEKAKIAQDKGATRFCLGAAWRSPPKKAMPVLTEAIEKIKALGMETCLTAGMLSDEQACELKEAGLDYYNHNLDTSREYYEKVVTTRTYDDRLNTLENVRKYGMHVCSGGILGMGEGRDDRIGLLQQLANLPAHPKSVPINRLVRIKGTPLGDTEEMDSLEFVRTVAVARIIMPGSYVRLAAGRENMTEELQALCFMAGANSMFYGEKLLTNPNRTANDDEVLLDKLGIKVDMSHQAETEKSCCAVSE